MNPTRLRLLKTDCDPDAVSLDAEERRRAYEMSRLAMMRSYAEAAACRREFILNYFGESFDPRDCRRCDKSLNIRGMPSTAPIGPFPVGMAVRHTSWGEGIRRARDARQSEVLFGAVGFKTFDLALVQERKLIEPVDVGAGRNAPLAS